MRGLYGRSQIKFPGIQIRMLEEYRDVCLRTDTHREGQEARLSNAGVGLSCKHNTDVSHFPRELRSWGGPAEVFKFGQNEAKC